MKTKLILLSAILLLTISSAHSQKAEQDSIFRRYFIGSSLFMLGNFIPDDPNSPDFVQLNFGYWLTQKDVISVEAITWKYAWPLGIPFGSSFESPEEKYPGYIREYGIGVAYQRFLWKGLYSAIHATPFLQKYVNENGEKIQNGFQLFLTARLGYHIRLFKDRFFLEPGIAVTHWPINTNVPESFAQVENKWPNYFLFEPGLHFGFKFK